MDFQRVYEAIVNLSTLKLPAAFSAMITQMAWKVFALRHYKIGPNLAVVYRH